MKLDRKLLIICGPTATGKTELAVRLAKKLDGEILSADSRQVYKGMDIGTGKDLEIYQQNKIKVWGLDLVDPDFQFNLGAYKKYAQQIIREIWERGKLPIVVGGTGLYLKVFLEPLELANIPYNVKLRKKLEFHNVSSLKEELEQIDKDKLRSMNNSDKNNPRRLMRAIEISSFLRSNPHYDIAKYHGEKVITLCIALKAPNEVIFKKIEWRIQKRLQQGIIKEIENLLKKGYSWHLPSMSGLGYQEFKTYWEKKESLKKVLARWQTDEQNFVKRQMAWFAKMKDLNWFDITMVDFYTEVENFVCQKIQKT